ncbi:uncharacterized protein LOC127791219 [Diospyros lotus]|uniref:uncharacterized protein LOC127791219 n=1 Tax=Diospyros lotus TaxID=55363 RepID=UPI002257867C|nr:uncharacterized protein LOC127791219 [Diospyros lotus]
MELELTIVKSGAESDYYYPLKRHARRFLVTTAAIRMGTDNQQIADKKMSNLQPVEYVSLKNLPPPTPPFMTPPAFKDPILRRAASAYLMPGMAAAAAADPGFACRAKDVCVGCVRGFLNDVVWNIIKSVFSKNRNNVDVDDGDGDGDGDRKVD